MLKVNWLSEKVQYTYTSLKLAHSLLDNSESLLFALEIYTKIQEYQYTKIKAFL